MLFSAKSILNDYTLFQKHPGIWKRTLQVHIAIAGSTQQKLQISLFFASYIASILKVVFLLEKSVLARSSSIVLKPLPGKNYS